jgi:sulfate adenylyltransferase subunit 1
MVTGASNSDLAIILVDARHGVVEQTRSPLDHRIFIESSACVVAINKMDLVGYSEDVYNNIVIDYAKVAASLGLKEVTYIPISALNGDNVVDASVNMNWYEGQSLLHFLENVSVDNDIDLTHGRFPFNM